mgnify:CR=1 FL=1
MSFTSSNKNKITAIFITIGVHALLLVSLLFIVLVTPLPAFEVKEVPEFEIDLEMEGLGSMEAGGSGLNDPEVTAAQITSTNKSPDVSNSAPAIVTSDVEESTNVESSTNTSPQNAEEPAAPKPQINDNVKGALAAWKNKKGKGSGGGNNGGSGNGTGGSIGNGQGTGIGNGDYSLHGRTLVAKPKQIRNAKEGGIVVVEIIVNAAGKVIKATPGKRGTTTTSAQLFAMARQAALSAKFNPSTAGIREQRGTYTFVFTLE